MKVIQDLNKKFLIILIISLSAVFASSFWYLSNNNQEQSEVLINIEPNEAGPGPMPHSLTIPGMRERDYPGSDIVIEKTLPAKPNYSQYVVSYLSDGYKIFALMTVPSMVTPPDGWPVIIFNHGSIPPQEYETTERYAAHVDYFARRGYVVFKSDYRGHGESEGDPDGGWYSPSYVTDVLNAVASARKLPYVNAEKIGMWGHSMGGHLTIASMVVSEDVKVGMIWAGLTATHDELFDEWRARRRRSISSSQLSPYIASMSRRQELIDKYGTWQENPEFWQSAAPTSYLADLSGPVQLHHGTADTRVPVSYSEDLQNRIRRVGKDVELYTYAGADHNLSQSFSQAMARSVKFFDEILK